MSRIKNSFMRFLFVDRSASFIFFLSTATSSRMIRSSSCFDLDSPIAFTSSKKSFERCEPDMVAR